MRLGMRIAAIFGTYAMPLPASLLLSRGLLVGNNPFNTGFRDY
jgi:hypothetical protein